MSFPISPTLASATGSLFTGESSVDQSVTEITDLSVTLATAPNATGEESFAELIAPIVPTVSPQPDDGASIEVAVFTNDLHSVDAVESDATSTAIESVLPPVKAANADTTVRDFESPAVRSTIKKHEKETDVVATSDETVLPEIVVREPALESNSETTVAQFFREEQNASVPPLAKAPTIESKPSEAVSQTRPQAAASNGRPSKPLPPTLPLVEPGEPVASVETNRRRGPIHSTQPASRATSITGETVLADLVDSPRPQPEIDLQVESAFEVTPKPTSVHGFATAEIPAPDSPATPARGYTNEAADSSISATHPARVTADEITAVGAGSEITQPLETETHPPSEDFAPVLRESSRVITPVNANFESSPLTNETRREATASPIPTNEPLNSSRTFATTTASESVRPTVQASSADFVLNSLIHRTVRVQVPPVAPTSPTTAEVALQNGFIGLPADETVVRQLTPLPATPTTTAVTASANTDSGALPGPFNRPPNVETPQPLNSERSTPWVRSQPVDQITPLAPGASPAIRPDVVRPGTFGSADTLSVEAPYVAGSATNTPNQNEWVNLVNEEPALVGEEVSTSISATIGDEATATLARMNNDRSVLPSTNAEPIERQIAANIVTETEWIPDQGQGEFRMRLDPEELGEVRVRLIKSEGGMKAEISAARQSTATLLSSQVDQIRTALQHAGVETPEVHVESQTIDPHYSGEWNHQASQQNHSEYRPAAHYSPSETAQENEEATSQKPATATDRQLDLTI